MSTTADPTPEPGAGRRVLTIAGWSAAVCAVAYVLFVGWLYVAADGSSTDESDVTLASGHATFWFLFASPIIGGIVGVVRATRGASARTKVAWSLIGLVVMVVCWYALAAIGIFILDQLPGLDD